MHHLRIILLVGLLLGAFVGTGHAQSPQAPRFVSGSCPFNPGKGLVVGKDLRCGSLVVPLDRTQPQRGTIRLAVAIYTSPSPQRRDDPLIWLQGGPGGSTIGLFASAITARTLPLFARHRDLVLMDQRGTGYSQPNLGCPEVTHLFYKTLDRSLSDARQARLGTKALQTCHDRLVEANVDLDAINTQESAADVADLRMALGYPEVDLYGVSYGTRLALEVMRDFPQGVRSVVLDSVVPPGWNSLSGSAASIARMLRTVWKGCAASRSCSRAHPHLAATFERTVARLDAHPVTIGVVDSTTGRHLRAVLNGEALVGTLFQAMYDTALIPSIPKLIGQAAKGKYGLVAKVFGQVQFIPPSMESIGTYYAVKCADDGRRASVAGIEPALRGISRRVARDIAVSVRSDVAGCTIWNTKADDVAEQTVATGSMPTLVLSGQYDPITPPANGRSVAAALPHAYFFEFPGTGHAVYYTNICPYEITERFLDDPTTRPDGACIGDMKEPFGK